ncbi:MAG: metal ABC transporter substrate-binding protein [Chloroflexi bacterium]|nr:metal ABC transporter substrate-binding protein [Chloroflexota bacterium]
MKKIFNSITVFAIAAIFLAACGSAPLKSDGALNVLASTTFLADIAQNVAGDRAKVESLLPIGADPHSYQAAPSDVAKISESNLLILNGVEYEHFIETLLENAGGKRVIVEAATGLTPHRMEEHDGEEHAEGEEGHDHEAGDPHMWLDPNLVVTYVENIRDGFIQADPDGAETYKANAEAYIAQLKDLDKWIVEQVNAVPAERRLLVTNHEAMGYFAERYGFEVAGAVIPSFSSNASPSAQEMAALADEIKKLGAPAIFLDTADNDVLARQIADETGVMIVSDLHLESLTDGAPAPTYIDMMKDNVSKIVEALK